MAVETVAVRNERLTTNPIDIKQGGQFFEPLCNMLPSMIAQQVAGDSFEEEPPFGVAWIKETDKPYRPWYPSGATHKAAYMLDENNPFNGKRSMRIDIAHARCRAGISQDGFCLAKGVGYRLRLHLRSTNGQGAVIARAWLHGDGRTVAGPVELRAVGPDWTPFEATLKAIRTINNATLTIDFAGPGTLWLDRVYLIGEDAFLGLWRPDVVDAIKGLNCGIIRWGGSAIEGVNWTDWLGPWDRRVPYTTCWGGLEPNFVGQEEFVRLCQALGAEPLLCIRWTGQTPEDAAAQVEYFNGSAQTRHGALRAANGRAEPYRVTYWQIGNEVAGEAYDQSVLAFARAMKAVDPSIKLMASWGTAKTLSVSGGLIDYLCPHHYGCHNLARMEASLQEHLAIIAADAGGFSGSRAVKLAITEWNTTAGDMGLSRTMLQTLSSALAVARYHNLMHRHADAVEIANRSNLVDSFASGVIVTGPGRVHFSPAYYAQQMYQQSAGFFPLKLERSEERNGKSWPDLVPDISATASPDGRTLRVFAVNDTDQIKAVSFSLSGFSGPVRSAAQTVLKDHVDPLCPEGMNTADEPRRITSVSRKVKFGGSEFRHRFAPFSVTRLDMQLHTER